jgi:hypothetical protein
MAFEVRGYDEVKLFKIVKLNLCDKTKVSQPHFGQVWG